MKGILKGISREQLIRLLVENTPIAYIILDQDYRIHYINESFLKLRDLDLESTLGEVCYNISNAGVHCTGCAVEEALRTGQRAFISRKDIMPDGSVRFVDDYAIPLLTDRSTDRRYVLEIMVNRTKEMLGREQRDQLFDDVLSMLSDLLEAKDAYTATHSKDVRRTAVKLARAMGLTPAEVFSISVAASLHDIGKVRVPGAIINKPGKLTEEEFAVIKQHPVTSYQMLAGLSSFEHIRNIVRHHHERVDGRGYPDGLTGDAFSLGAKIVAVADTYDAITSTRSYRAAMPHEAALQEIARVAGTQLDTEVVETFLSMSFDADEQVQREQQKGMPPVVRRLKQQQAGSEVLAESADIFTRFPDLDMLLERILESTPCGYVVMDRDRVVYYASSYFLSYMGLTEQEVLGKRCFESAGVGAQPCSPCAIERALRSGKVEYMRQEQDTNNGHKIFELFGIPLVSADGSIDNVIEVIIDRTDEIVLDRQREQDYASLMGLLTDLLEETETDSERSLVSAELESLRDRLNNLLQG